MSAKARKDVVTSPQYLLSSLSFHLMVCQVLGLDTGTSNHGLSSSRLVRQSLGGICEPGRPYLQAGGWKGSSPDALQVKTGQTAKLQSLVWHPAVRAVVAQ